MGKYSGVVGGLPRLPAAEPSFQAQVDQAKGRVTSRGPGGLAARYEQLRNRKDRADRLTAKLNVQLAAVEQLMWSAYEDANLTMVRLSDGSSVAAEQEPYAAVRDQAACRAWAEANGHRASLQVPWPTVNAITKERLLAGLPPPDGVEIYSRTKTVLRRARGWAHRPDDETRHPF